MLRLFIGIKIEVTQVLLDLQNDLKKILQSDKINWVDPANFHITLIFLGEVEEILVDPLIKILERLSSASRIFTLTYDRLGFFGTQRQPNVIWFGFKDQEDLSKLKMAIDKATSELGFKTDNKEFNPHLTYGRVKKIEKSNLLIGYINSRNKAIKGEYSVKEFQLIRSILHPHGPEYKVLHAFKLPVRSDPLPFKNDQKGVN
jgi:2'-5' RNA ligase